MVLDSEPNKVADLVVDMKVDKVADMVVDMKVDKVADMNGGGHGGPTRTDIKKLKVLTIEAHC